MVGLKPSPPPPPEPGCAFDCYGLQFSYWDLGMAPYMIASAVALLVCSIAAALGFRLGRTALLISIVGHTCVWLSFQRPLSSWHLDDALVWVVWLMWLLLNVWAFFSRRAQEFYAKNA